MNFVVARVVAAADPSSCSLSSFLFLVERVLIKFGWNAENKTKTLKSVTVTKSMCTISKIIDCLFDGEVATGILFCSILLKKIYSSC